MNINNVVLYGLLLTLLGYITAIPIIRRAIRLLLPAAYLLCFIAPLVVLQLRRLTIAV